MFKSQYIEGSIVKQNPAVDFDDLMSLLKAHKEGQIKIQNVEDYNHYHYNVEKLIKELKL